MFQRRKFHLSNEEAKQLNIILPRGYKLVTPQQFKKKAVNKVKKKTMLGLPLNEEIVNTSMIMNFSLRVSQPQALSRSAPSILPTIRSTKNTKFMGIPSYQSIPQSDFYNPQVPGKSHQRMPPNQQRMPPNQQRPPSILQRAPSTLQRIPLNLSYYPQKRPQPLQTSVVFSKLKNHPQILQLDRVQPEQYSLSFKDIERKVTVQRDSYKVNQLVSDISKLCLKIYQLCPRDSNQYQNTVSIEKYLKSLTKVEKPETYTMPGYSVGLNRQQTGTSQVKKKPMARLGDFSSVLTIKQKRQLGQRIKKLPSQNLQQICFIIFQNLQNKQYSFDLQTLHMKKIRQLQQYVNSCQDYSQVKDNEDQSKLNDEQQGEQSSFIIQGDDQDQNTNINIQP